MPKWKDSRISFKNVFVTRRPQAISKVRADNNAAHHAAKGYDVSNHPANHGIEDDEDNIMEILPDEDTNYTMFDLDVDSIDVTLSLARWFDGKGLITDAVIKGVRGVVGWCSFYTLTEVILTVLQTDASCIGTQTILLTLLPFSTPHNQGTSNWNLCS